MVIFRCLQASLLNIQTKNSVMSNSTISPVTNTISTGIAKLQAISRTAHTIAGTAVVFDPNNDASTEVVVDYNTDTMPDTQPDVDWLLTSMRYIGYVLSAFFILVIVYLLGMLGKSYMARKRREEEESMNFNKQTTLLEYDA